MADPSSFRDSTQIILPMDSLDGIRCELESRFMVTVHEEGGVARIIGSPVVIKDVNDFLVRNGISLP